LFKEANRSKSAKWTDIDETFWRANIQHQHDFTDIYTGTALDLSESLTQNAQMKEPDAFLIRSQEEPLPPPSTSVEAHVKQQNRDKIIWFFEDWVKENLNSKSDMKYKNDEFFKMYTVWCEASRVEINYNKISFGMKITVLMKKQLNTGGFLCVKKDTSNSTTTLYFDEFIRFFKALNGIAVQEYAVEHLCISTDEKTSLKAITQHFRDTTRIESITLKDQPFAALLRNATLNLGPKWVEQVEYYNMNTGDGRGMGYLNVAFSHLMVGIAKNTTPVLPA
jgi:hypothetical protein